MSRTQVEQLKMKMENKKRKKKKTEQKKNVRHNEMQRDGRAMPLGLYVLS